MKDFKLLNVEYPCVNENDALNMALNHEDGDVPLRIYCECFISEFIEIVKKEDAKYNPECFFLECQWYTKNNYVSNWFLFYVCEDGEIIYLSDEFDDTDKVLLNYFKSKTKCIAE